MHLRPMNAHIEIKKKLDAAEFFPTIVSKMDNKIKIMIKYEVIDGG